MRQAISMTRTAIAPRNLLPALLFGLALALVQAIAVQARPAPDGFADLVAKVSPAVVNITTTSTVAVAQRPAPPVVPEGSPLEDFFRDFLDRQQRGSPQPREERRNALGSGFVISEDGFIVTNNHVIEEADEVIVEFQTGESHKATVVGKDRNVDIALLKIDAGKPLPFVTFGDSDVMRVGDWVLAIGNPLGQGFSASAGIVSARKRELSGPYDDFIQTDAAINRGNSGGPLFNIDGQVIGVNTAILSPSGGSIGIGFSMASNVVQGVVAQLKEFGETRRGWLGVRIQDVTDDVAEALGLEAAKGALVTDVPDGPSKEAGLQPGDVILSFDGQDVADTRDLVRRVGNTEVGKAVRVVVFREGGTQTLRVTLGRREEAEGQPASVAPEAAPEAESGSVLGITLSTLTDDLRQQLGLDAGAAGLVVTDVDAVSDAYEKGLRAGDLIAEANQQAVADVAGLKAQIDAARDAGRKSILLLVRRSGEPRFIALAIGKDAG